MDIVELSLWDLPLKELDDIPVYILDKEYLKTIYEYKKCYKFNDKYGGFFGKSNMPDICSAPSIFINKALSIEKQILVFFHEYGHYNCFELPPP
jgi:Zn-dependent peptidase ImmA (M78 family)